MRKKYLFYCSLCQTPFLMVNMKCNTINFWNRLMIILQNLDSNCLVVHMLFLYNHLVQLGISIFVLVQNDPIMPTKIVVVCYNNGDNTSKNVDNAGYIWFVDDVCCNKTSRDVLVVVYNKSGHKKIIIFISIKGGE
jgi:hypothetical protein